MKTDAPRNAPAANEGGVTLIECLVYISVVTVLLGIGTMAFWRCWDANNALRRNADDIVHALHTGEQWRADVRAATGPIQLENADGVQRLRIPGSKGETVYALADGELRRQSPGAIDAVMLHRVKASRMQPDSRQRVAAWRWELELERTRKSTVLRPRFTFDAVPGNSTLP